MHPALHLAHLHLLLCQPPLRMPTLGVGPHDQESRLIEVVLRRFFDRSGERNVTCVDHRPDGEALN